MKQTRNTIVILEDNLDRLELFTGAIGKLPRKYEIAHFDDVKNLKSMLPVLLKCACLFSLDYCLDDSRSPSKSPGNGMDAIKLLVPCQPACPVIVHTALPAMSLEMSAILTGRGWNVKRVPFNNSTRVHDWNRAASEFLGLKMTTLADRSNPRANGARG